MPYSGFTRATESAVRVPSTRELMRYRLYNAIQAPLPDDMFWQLDTLHAIRSLRDKPDASPSAPVPPVTQSSVQSSEARVREGNRAYHEQLLARWGIPMPELHPTNHGLSAMRIKNACLAAVRRGEVV